MSTPFLNGAKPWNQQAASGTTTYYSEVTILPRVEDLMYLISFLRASGTFAGTLTVEVSAEAPMIYQAAYAADAGLPGGTQVNLLLWDTYNPTGFTIPAISTVTEQKLNLKITDLGASLIRLKYVNATGTGTVTAQVSAK